jgi:hypothetical protein
MKINGQIVDKDGKGMPSASLTVVNSDFASLGVGTIADADGNFQLDNPVLDEPGNRVMISFIGYNAIDKAPSELQGSKIVMSADANSGTMEEFVITAKKKLKQLTNNYNWYYISVGATAAAVVVLSVRFYKGLY